MAKRYANNKTPSLPPVEKVELNEKNIKLRVVLFIVLLVIGIVAIGFGVSFLFAKESGWYAINPEYASKTTGSGFAFYYYLEDEGFFKKTERSAVTSQYSTSMDRAYMLFNNLEFAETNNLATLNKNPNKEFIVDPALYSVLEKLKTAGVRNHFLAPLYSVYYNIYNTENDVFLTEYDPLLNSEMHAFFDSVLGYINDTSKIDLVLLGENKVRLFVSEDYIDFARKENITSFVDFGWMTNAFVVDYVADKMVEKGFNKGSFSSSDGFIRNFCSTNDSFYANIYDVVENDIYHSATFKYNKNMSIISYKGFILSPADKGRYYLTDNGKLYTPYVSTVDGLTKATAPYLLVYSDSNKCVDLLVKTISSYVGESLDTEELALLSSSSVYYVYCKDSKVLTNDESAVFVDVFKDDLIEYTVEVK